MAVITTEADTGRPVNFTAITAVTGSGTTPVGAIDSAFTAIIPDAVTGRDAVRLW